MARPVLEKPDDRAQRLQAYARAVGDHAQLVGRHGEVRKDQARCVGVCARNADLGDVGHDVDGRPHQRRGDRGQPGHVSGDAFLERPQVLLGVPDLPERQLRRGGEACPKGGLVLDEVAGPERYDAASVRGVDVHAPELNGVAGPIRLDLGDLVRGVPWKRFRCHRGRRTGLLPEGAGGRGHRGGRRGSR